MTQTNSSTTQSSIKNDQKMQSFLHDAQKEGKATGKIELKDLDKAMADVPKILNEDIAEFYRNTPEEDWPTCKMAIYSHDARDIVPAGIGRTVRGKERIVCGVTGSKKIARGREDALRKFYHIDENKKKDEEGKSTHKSEKPERKKNFFKRKPRPKNKPRGKK